ncbi:MAG TPA: c-type cytochrome, partial [Candidatus Binataceae bacterium]|nr:c-type cytochrome [Candidatus Binataceae bacterium]
ADQRIDVAMHQELTNLTDQQNNDVSTYLASLSEGKPSAAAQGGAVTQEQVAETARVCSSCHEFDGGSAAPDFIFPRLAGQQKPYLIAQLKAFRGKTRADARARTYMWDRAASLDDAMIERLAAYYAAESPVSGSPQDPTQVAAGKTIYDQGIAEKVLPCMACHGAKAEGIGATPRLAGQHRLSLARQLAYFAANTRTGGIMHHESTNLTDQQTNDVSTYLAALSEGKPSAAAQAGAVTREQVAAAARFCSSCHEFDGGSAAPEFIFPRLAGQQKAYLVAQLKAFRDKTRADPRARTYMWGVAALSDAMIERLAAYYAAESPGSGSSQDPTQVAAGRKIYEQGIPHKIPPCMTCHGAGAKGAGTRPRLAGQHRLSLERQLAYFAANTRTGGMMHRESMNLTDQQIKDLSAYLAAR